MRPNRSASQLASAPSEKSKSSLQEAGPGASQLGARLVEPRRALREVEVLGDRRLDELGEQRIVEQPPVFGEVERGRRRARFNPCLGHGDPRFGSLEIGRGARRRGKRERDDSLPLPSCHPIPPAAIPVRPAI